MIKLKSLLPFASGLLLLACGQSDPAITTFTVSPATVSPGDTLTIDVAVENFRLVDPDGGGHGLRPANEDGHGDGDGEPLITSEGHFHIYMDSTDTNPLLFDCPSHCKHAGFYNPLSVTTPTTATAGSHKLILRLNANDHRTLTPHIKAEATIMVQ